MTMIMKANNLIWKTQNIDSYLNKEQFNDWVAINNAHKKVLSYKFQNNAKEISKKIQLISCKIFTRKKDKIK